MRIGLTVILTLAAAAATAQPVVRHYGPQDGLSHSNIRDIMQDSTGYMWFATWSGVDRFDGYEFRNFRSFPSDPVKLDNNRIERLSIDPGGYILVETYGKRRYRLDSSRGTFSIAGDCTGLPFGKERPRNQVRPELTDYPVTSPQSFVDRDGNLWIARDGGIDFVTTGDPAFSFIDSSPLDSIGSNIHTVYAAPDGRIWCASRDTRIIVYDSDGTYIGNLSADGRIVADPQLASGVRAYSFMADTDGRLWIGTKSQRLLVLTPLRHLEYAVSTYLPSDEPGGLSCANIYDIVRDNDGSVWLATFGGGIVSATATHDNRLTFSSLDTFAGGKASRIRRLLPLSDSCMVAAATDGVAVFDPRPGHRTSAHFNRTESSRPGSLSNDDVLNVLAASDGTLYLSVFSGGIDYARTDEPLFTDSITFGHLNIRNGLCVDPVLSVTQDADSCFWVASTYAVARYSLSWQLLSVFDRSNLGREVEFTEAAPQHLPDGRIVFGMNGGILIADPSRLSHRATPPLVVTDIESSNSVYDFSHDDIITLPRGHRDIAISFAALQYAGAPSIRYAWRDDDSGDWTDLGHERVLRLSSLPAGIHNIYIRSTDANGLWADNTVCVTVDVPRTITEIIYNILLALGIAALLACGVWIALREARRRRRGNMLDRCIAAALHRGTPPDGIIGQIAMTVGRDYPDDKLKAEHISSAIGMPRNELRRIVKEQIGISLEEFIRTVRVKAACSLLSAGGLTVAETAYKCGFRTPQYMSMVFKEQTGHTPGEYIKKSCK